MQYHKHGQTDMGRCSGAGVSMLKNADGRGGGGRGKSCVGSDLVVLSYFREMMSLVMLFQTIGRVSESCDFTGVTQRT